MESTLVVEVVDGNLRNASALRGSVERYISDNDVSNDKIQTPKVVIVIGGGAKEFEYVKGQLDADDATTGTAVPVLVIADSGGVAEDIYNYCTQGLVLPTVDTEKGRDEEYVQQAREYLPQILEHGQKTGQNANQQLAFFKLSEDLDARDNLALDIEKAMLNDCPDVKQEALLAVKWKNPDILRKHLLDDSQAVLTRDENKAKDETKEDVDVLQVALSRPGGADTSVVRTILTYVAEPTGITMDNLFHKSFDRYPVEETRGKWKDSRMKRPSLHQMNQMKTKPSDRTSHRGSRILPSFGGHDSGRDSLRVAPEELSANGNSGTPLKGATTPAYDGGAGTLTPNAASTPTTVLASGARTPTGTFFRSSSRQKLEAAEVACAWYYASKVLSAVVDGYEDHLDARRAVNPTIRANWTDLMMWGVSGKLILNAQLQLLTTHIPADSVWLFVPHNRQVLSGQHELAEALWEKTSDPIRAALMASQLCRRLMDEPSLRADMDSLETASIRYEDCALDLLSAIRDSSQAAQLITLIPWEYVQLEDGCVERKLLWDSSSVESAAEEDGLLSVPCMRFISHRHTEYLIEKHFVGDFPGSKACIPPENSSILRSEWLQKPKLMWLFASTAPNDRTACQVRPL